MSARPRGLTPLFYIKALDIEAESSHKQLEIDQISRLQEYKTGKLISWSCEVGPIIAGENAEPFATYASKIGLAFQIIDDILMLLALLNPLEKW